MHTIYRHPDLHDINYSMRPLWHELRAEMRHNRAVRAERGASRPVTSRATRVISDRVKTGKRG